MTETFDQAIESLFDAIDSVEDYIDGRQLGGATTSATSSFTVQFAADHGINLLDIGKTGWVLDSSGNGAVTTIVGIPSSTQITLSGQCGKKVTAGGFVYGTPVNDTLVAALADAATLTTVDPAAGANRPWGPVSAAEVNVSGGTGIAILTTQLHVQYGTRFNNDGIIYANGLANDIPYFLFDSNTSIGNLTIDVGSGRGIHVGDSTTSQTHFSWNRIEVWGRGSVTGSHLIEFYGLDCQGNQIWTKGGDTAVRCISGTDSRFGHIFAIGAKTGLAISGGSQITAKIFSDTERCAVRIWGGADNISLDVQAFINSASTTGLCPAVVFGVKDDGTTSNSLNQNIRLDIQVRDTGAPVVTLANCQNIWVRGFIAPRMSNGAVVRSSRGQVVGAVYGAGVGDGIDIDLAFPSLTQVLDDGATPAYALFSGTPVGQYIARFDGKVVFVAGGPYTFIGGTATAPVLQRTY